MRGTLIAALILSILVTIFVLKNNLQIEIDYLIGKKNFSFPILMFTLLALGSIITLLVSIPSWYRKRKLIKSLNKEIQRLNSELQENTIELIPDVTPDPPQEDVDDFTKDVETEY